MSFYSENAVDWRLASDGIWVDLQGGARIKLRCAHAPAAAEDLRKLVASYPEIDELLAMEATTPDEIARKARVLGSLVVNVCAVEWEGIDDEKGRDVRTREQLLRLFQRPELIVVVSRLAMIGVTTAHFTPDANSGAGADEDKPKRARAHRKADKDKLAKN